jgi:hypothetical protein
MKPAKVRLLEAAFKSYTGFLCGVHFEDGVSITELPFVDQQRICASMRAETIEGKNVSPSGIYSTRHTINAGDIKETAAPEVINLAREEDSCNSRQLQRFSREELEAIADNEGIVGLRLVGNSLGVKSKGIVEMIDNILKAQGGL